MVSLDQPSSCKRRVKKGVRRYRPTGLEGGDVVAFDNNRSADARFMRTPDHEVEAEPRISALCVCALVLLACAAVLIPFLCRCH